MGRLKTCLCRDSTPDRRHRAVRTGRAIRRNPVAKIGQRPVQIAQFLDGLDKPHAEFRHNRRIILKDQDGLVPLGLRLLQNAQMAEKTPPCPDGWKGARSLRPDRLEKRSKAVLHRQPDLRQFRFHLATPVGAAFQIDDTQAVDRTPKPGFDIFYHRALLSFGLRPFRHDLVLLCDRSGELIDFHTAPY